MWEFFFTFFIKYGYIHKKLNLMENESRPSVILADPNATYEEYLKLLKESYDSGKKIPSGSIVFPFPSTLEEYQLLAEVKAKIFFYFVEQYVLYKFQIKQLVLFSLELAEHVRKLNSWEHLDPADYTLLLSSQSFDGVLFGMFVPKKTPGKATEIVLLFEISDSKSNSLLEDIYVLRESEVGYEIANGKKYKCLKISSARILGISW